MIGRAYSRLRDDVGKALAPLRGFLRHACPAMGMVHPTAYLMTHNWIMQSDGSGNVTLTQTSIPVAARRVDGETEDGLMRKIHDSGYRLANGEAVSQHGQAFQIMTAPWMTATTPWTAPDARNGPPAGTTTAPDGRDVTTAGPTTAPGARDGPPAGYTTAPDGRDVTTAHSTTAPDASDGLVRLIRDMRANSLEAVHRALGTTPGAHLGYNYVVHWLRDAQDDAQDAPQGGEMAR